MSLDDLFDPQLYPQFDAPYVSGMDTTHDNIMVNEVMIHATEDEEEDEVEIPMNEDMYESLSPLDVNTPAVAADGNRDHHFSSTVTPNNGVHSDGQMSLDAHFATSRSPVSPLTPPPVDVTPPPAPPSGAPTAPVTPGRGGVCVPMQSTLHPSFPHRSRFPLSIYIPISLIIALIHSINQKRTLL